MLELSNTSSTGLWLERISYQGEELGLFGGARDPHPLELAAQFDVDVEVASILMEVQEGVRSPGEVAAFALPQLRELTQLGQQRRQAVKILLRCVPHSSSIVVGVAQRKDRPRRAPDADPWCWHRTEGDRLGAMTEQSGSEPADRDSMPQGRMVIVGPDGMAIAGDSDQERERPLADLVEQPAKVMRIGSMIRQLLEEVRASPLDEKSRVRLREIHERSVKELESGLAPELSEELERLSLPFTEDEAPSEAELRVAQAQLVGWLEGLFHGIQTTLFAQQMAARAQLEQMRRALPPGVLPPGGDEGSQPPRASGPYL
jgi:proteasome activator-like protein